MKPYAVVQIVANSLSRLVFETANSPPARQQMYEGYYHVSGTKQSKDVTGAASLKDPCCFYFADNEVAAKALANTLAQWNPGTSWQVMKLSGVVTSNTPSLSEKLVIKNITDKGFLPE